MKMEYTKNPDTEQKIGRTVTRFFTYPILGNLSHAWKQDLEHTLKDTHDVQWFDSENASWASRWTNIITYGLAGAILGYAIGGDGDPEKIGALTGAGLATVESIVRSIGTYQTGKQWGSLFGKLISLPYEFKQKTTQLSEEHTLDNITDTTYYQKTPERKMPKNPREI
jgi:hypothetical protein